ncbi:MAG: helix-turn-helix transcriptional regulator [Chloroflexi bacterium]|nr:helix-turn-helix transcriptional regulator [Chloroflexota bacterium]
MPGRAYGRRGRPRGHFQRGRIYRFVEPCLLLLLHQGCTHGYDLVRALAEFGFGESPWDPSVVYRRLQAMEEAGLVSSMWDDDSQGPPRRVYCLTAEGDRHLARWIEELRIIDRVLHTFLTAHDEHMQEGAGAYH